MRGKSAAITLTIKPDFASPAGRLATNSARDKTDVNAAQTIHASRASAAAAFDPFAQKGERKR